VNTVRAEVLAQCLAAHFEEVEHWEWNEVADWIIGVFLPTERSLGRVKDLLGIEGATSVSYDQPLDPALGYLVDVLGLRLEVREISRHRQEKVFVRA
jgi:hypothetical protein